MNEIAKSGLKKYLLIMSCDGVLGVSLICHVFDIEGGLAGMLKPGDSPDELSALSCEHGSHY